MDQLQYLYERRIGVSKDKLREEVHRHPYAAGAVRIQDSTAYFAFAWCSTEDQFSKHTAKHILAGRLEHMDYLFRWSVNQLQYELWSKGGTLILQAAYSLTNPDIDALLGYLDEIGFSALVEYVEDYL